MDEVKNISDIARILYIIFIHCEFVPVEYLCLLAIIMTQHDNLNYCELLFLRNVDCSCRWTASLAAIAVSLAKATVFCFFESGCS